MTLPKLADSSRRQHRNPPSLKRASQDAESQWLQRHSGIVWKVVHLWHGNCNVPLEDLRAIASIGALKACRKFDESKLEKGGSALKAEASLTYSYANGEIMHHLRRHGKMVLVPRLWREQYAKVRRLARERGKPDDKPTMEAIARDLGLKEWRRILEACTMPRMLHPDSVPENEDGLAAWDAVLGVAIANGYTPDEDEGDEPPDPRCEDPYYRRRVATVIKAMPDPGAISRNAPYLRDLLELPSYLEGDRVPGRQNGRAFRGDRPKEYLGRSDQIPYQFQRFSMRGDTCMLATGR